MDRMAPGTSQSAFQRSMEDMEQSARRATSDLLPLVYDELRRMAATQMSRGSANSSTLQPTALVHEAWMRLGGTQQPQWENRAHFFAAAAESMRNILIDRARRRCAIRHGGGLSRVDLSEVDIGTDAGDEQLLAVSESIYKLARQHPQMAEFVKLRCFVGLEVSEAALALDISRATATRWWLFARTWLFQELQT